MKPRGADRAAPALRCAHCKARLGPWPGPLAVVGLLRGTVPPARLRPITSAQYCRRCGWTTLWEPLEPPAAGEASDAGEAPEAGEAPGPAPPSGHEADRAAGEALPRPAMKRGRGKPDIRTWHASAYRPMPRRGPEKPR